MGCTLTNLGFATRHADRLVPTVAGLLLFGARPQDGLSAATLKCAFFYGRHQGTQLRDRADVVGPLTRAIDEGAAFVARNRRLVPRMEGVRRVDVPEYPDASVREAIATAVAYRDWSLEGAKVRLFLLDDQMEILSPGRLPPPMTLPHLADGFCLHTVALTPTLTPTGPSMGVNRRSGPVASARRWRADRRCPSLPRGGRHPP
jgi:ATP-dependent DNA helicase RecG